MTKQTTDGGDQKPKGCPLNTSYEEIQLTPKPRPPRPKTPVRLVEGVGLAPPPSLIQELD